MCANFISTPVATELVAFSMTCLANSSRMKTVNIIPTIRTDATSRYPFLDLHKFDDSIFLNQNQLHKEFLKMYHIEFFSL